MTRIDHLTVAAEEGWQTLFDLAEVDDENWLLIGGQMMHLLAAEHGVSERVRPTDDVDIVMDVRAKPRGTEWLAGWLQDRGFDLEGASPDGIGHRFVRDAGGGGVGQTIIDVLAPEGLGSRTTTYTVRPFRTVRLLGALIAKAAATGIAVRQNPERDWQDAALLLATIPDPIGAAEECTAKDRERVRKLKPLENRDHRGWDSLDDEAYRRGTSTLAFLLNP